MKGYFTHLAKLSGVAIGGGTPPGRAGRRALPRVQPEAAGALLHTESVVLVDPTPAGEAALGRPSVEGTNRNKEVAVELPPFRSERRLSSEDPLAASEVAKSNFYRPSADDPDKQIAEQADLRFVRESTRPLALKGVSASDADVSGPIDVGLERHADGKPGVIRVGEVERTSELTLTNDADSFAASARPVDQPESSMPRDYLEAIREWLGAPTGRGNETQNRNLVEQNSEIVATPSEQANRSLRSEIAYRDLAPQNDIQEFSLSIGSISIVVEEPAQQPLQQPKTPQAPMSTSAAAQPRARDAFALSRSYFRGF